MEPAPGGIGLGAHEEFTEYATASATRLREIACLMCRDWHQAQDLTQATLAKVFVAWPRITRREKMDAAFIQHAAGTVQVAPEPY
jgi:DNA-directed RNA polymerase specialized sigma24 family protein